MAYVYQHVRLDTNEVFYIGMGSNKKRAYSKDSRSEHWHNVVNKAGYSVQIIAEGISYQDALALEIQLVKVIGRKDLGLGPLVNKTDGGEGQINMSEETRQKISESLSGRKGIPCTKEHKQKLSNLFKNVKLSEHHKQKLSNSHKGMKLSEKQKQKISDKLKGIPQKKVTCPYCLKEGGYKNMKRWHFNNCKNNQ